LEQIRAIAEDKMPDLNAFTLESAMSMVVGTAKSGITVSELLLLIKKDSKMTKKQKRGCFKIDKNRD
jgi:hypothetical protein